MNDLRVVPELLRTLEACLAELDRLGLLVSAAHLETAIHHLREEARANRSDDERP